MPAPRHKQAPADAAIHPRGCSARGQIARFGARLRLTTFEGDGNPWQNPASPDR